MKTWDQRGGVRNQIVERFSKSRMLKSYDKIYNDLINT